MELQLDGEQSEEILITNTCSNDALDWHLCPLVRYGGGPPRFGGGGGSRGGPPMGKFGNPGERLRKKHWNLDELPKFQKNFYQEHPDTSHRPLVRPAHCCSALQMLFPVIFSWLSKVEHKAVCTQLVLSLVYICVHTSYSFPAISYVLARGWTIPAEQRSNGQRKGLP